VKAERRRSWARCILGGSGGLWANGGTFAEVPPLRHSGAGLTGLAHCGGGYMTRRKPRPPLQRQCVVPMRGRLCRSEAAEVESPSRLAATKLAAARRRRRPSHGIHFYSQNLSDEIRIALLSARSISVHRLYSPPNSLSRPHPMITSPAGMSELVKLSSSPGGRSLRGRRPQQSQLALAFAAGV
jgi:hypothetical protein